MYRQYEDPYKIQEMLNEARADFAEAVESGEDEERLIALHEDVADLEARLNYAWQDDEAEVEGYC